MRRAAALLALVGACYGPPTPESCYRKYGDGDAEGHRVCMAHYRRRNGMATEADWYLLESRNNSTRRPQAAAPLAVVNVTQSTNAPQPTSACKRWECVAADAGQSCRCTEIATVDFD